MLGTVITITVCDRVTPISLGRRAEIKLFLKVENKPLGIYSPLPIEDGEFWLDGHKCPLYPLPHAFKEITALMAQILNLPYGSSSISH